MASDKNYSEACGGAVMNSLADKSYVDDVEDMLVLFDPEVQRQLEESAKDIADGNVWLFMGWRDA